MNNNTFEYTENEELISNVKKKTGAAFEYVYDDCRELLNNPPAGIDSEMLTLLSQRVMRLEKFVSFEAPMKTIIIEIKLILQAYTSLKEWV